MTPLVPLGELASFVSGGTPSRGVAHFYSGDIAWITGADIDAVTGRVAARAFITADAVRASATNQVPAGTILLVTRTSVGKVGLAPIPLCFSQDVTGIHVDEARVSRRYLVHFLRANETHFTNHARGATIKGVTREVVTSLAVPLPPLAEQRRIAAILDHADALRVKRRASLTLLDELTQAVFLDMFGDPDQALRRGLVKKFSEIVSNLEGGKSLVADDPGGASRHRVLKISAVTQMHYRPSQSKAVPDDYEPPASHFVQQGDLLMSRANTSELVGALAYVWQTPPRLLLPDKLWRFVWRSPDEVEPLYVWALLRTPAMRRQLSQRSSGTGGSMKNISKAKLMDMPVPWSPHPLQQRFAAAVHQVNGLRARAEDHMTELEAGTRALQRQAFVGQP